MSELAQWKQKQATGALNDRQERRMQFLQNQQQRQRMANQAEQVMQRGFEQSRTGAPTQAPAPQQNWTQGVPAPDMSQAAPMQSQQSNLTPFQQQVSRFQSGEYKLNNPQSWPIHASNRPQGGIQDMAGQAAQALPNGQNIDPGYSDPSLLAKVPQNWSPTPNLQMPQNGGLGTYRPGSNQQLDKVFDYLKRNRRPAAY